MSGPEALWNVYKISDDKAPITKVIIGDKYNTGGLAPSPGSGFIGGDLVNKNKIPPSLIKAYYEWVDKNGVGKKRLNDTSRKSYNALGP